MTTEEVGCLRSDVGRQKAEVGTTELRRETNTNLTDDTNMRDHGDERTQMTRIKRIYGTTELRRELVPAISNSFKKRFLCRFLGSLHQIYLSMLEKDRRY